ncbi:hypothetical protein C4579_02980 [Candidatus Microgenomates bacterium]|nr:MAG: hypothetical protein C4579_02980 [Candidatus Microgenomates bacterium]
MNNQKIILSSLALDLRRVAQGYHRNSLKMADRFLQEALKRKKEAQVLALKPYLQTLLTKIEELRFEKDLESKAELAMMYSTLFQNAAIAD